MKLGKGMSALGTKVTTDRSPKPNGTVYGVQGPDGKIEGFTADQLYPREN